MNLVSLLEQSTLSLSPIDIALILQDSDVPIVIRKRIGLWIANRLYTSGDYTVAQSFFATLRRHRSFESKTSDLAVVEALNELYYRWHFERANTIVNELSQQIASMGLSGMGNTDIEKNYRSLTQIVTVSQQMYNRVVHLPIEVQNKIGMQQLSANQRLQTMKQYHLAQNYPNPFNPVTTIKYTLPRESLVKIEVFDILGRKVTTLVNGRETAGEKVVHFNASRMASGVYFYQLKAGGFVETKKMMLVK